MSQPNQPNHGQFPAAPSYGSGQPPHTYQAQTPVSGVGPSAPATKKRRVGPILAVIPVVLSLIFAGASYLFYQRANDTANPLASNGIKDQWKKLSKRADTEHIQAMRWRLTSLSGSVSGNLEVTFIKDGQPMMVDSWREESMPAANLDPTGSTGTTDSLLVQSFVDAASSFECPANQSGEAKLMALPSGKSLYTFACGALATKLVIDGTEFTPYTDEAPPDVAAAVAHAAFPDKLAGIESGFGMSGKKSVSVRGVGPSATCAQISVLLLPVPQMSCYDQPPDFTIAADRVSAEALKKALATGLAETGGGDGSQLTYDARAWREDWIVRAAQGPKVAWVDSSGKKTERPS